MKFIFFIQLISILLVVTDCRLCHIPHDNYRFDCHPIPDASESSCLARGCCWNDPLSESNPSVPMCYFPRNYSSYVVKKSEKTTYGYRYFIEKTQLANLPQEITSLIVHVYFINEHVVRIRITDENNTGRFEVPYVYTNSDDQLQEPTQKNLNVQVNTNPFELKIVHSITGKTLFDSSVAPLLYSDKFIQISTVIPSYFVYGLGEHRNPLRMTTSWQTLAFWNRDQPPILNHNLYGSNPFALFVDDDGYASGYFMLNSNAMEAHIQPAPAITFRTIGGIIDLFVYGGIDPEDVIRQHWNVIGSPYFQPMWAMGLHLCRYGYLDINDVKNLIDRMNSSGFPYDVQWTDIDAMRNYLVFTYDTEKWAGLPDLVHDLHQRNMFYIPINDPCIGALEPPGTYSALDDGLNKDVFIKHPDNSILMASVWPGQCYMPDFTHPNAFIWWRNQIDVFNATAPIDGLWIDMNEPANFVNGSVTGCQAQGSDLDHPWYVPHVIDRSLISKTICASGKQSIGTQYDLHSLYGLIEAKVSMEALESLNPLRRHFVVTRAHFSGVGKWAAHWTGDNYATWDDLYYSIPEALTFNMFGITFVGPDICGFWEDTTEELCMRWMQLGAFLPFMRNHNGIGYVHQDPAIWSEPARNVMKQALMMRYMLTPLWYTAHYNAHMNRYTVLQPLFYLYPKDDIARWIDTQFFIARTILVAPVLTSGATRLSVYLPPTDKWYRFPSTYDDRLELVQPSKSGYIEEVVYQDTLCVYVRSGAIVPIMSIDSNKNLIQNAAGNLRFKLLVTLPSQGNNVEANLYWDDGLAIANTENTLIDMLLHENTLTLSKRKILFNGNMILEKVIIAGFKNENVWRCTISDRLTNCQLDNNSILDIDINLNVNTADVLTIRWDFDDRPREL